MQDSIAMKNKSLALKLVVVVIGMFAFATLVLPPMYDVFCEITGLNGKVSLTPCLLYTSPSPRD